MENLPLTTTAVSVIYSEDTVKLLRASTESVLAPKPYFAIKITLKRPYKNYINAL